MATSIQPAGTSGITVEEIRRQAVGIGSSGTNLAAHDSAKELGKEAFLKLLTVQLKNQDPMDPIKNEAFVAQLAQFSSLEQLQNINQALTDGNKSGSDQSAATLAAVSNNTAVSLIGKQVEVTRNSLSLPVSGTATVAFNLEGNADSLTAEIADQAGRHVRTLSLHPSGLQGPIVWDGRDDAGIRQDAGLYQISLSAQAGSQPVNARSVATRDITGVRTRQGTEPLLLYDGGTAPLSTVSGIFNKG